MPDDVIAPFDDDIEQHERRDRSRGHQCRPRLHHGPDRHAHRRVGRQLEPVRVEMRADEAVFLDRDVEVAEGAGEALGVPRERREASLLWAMIRTWPPEGAAPDMFGAPTAKSETPSQSWSSSSQTSASGTASTARSP